MATRLFYDKDCSLDALSGKTILFVGYGNQGRAQAQNLRDTCKTGQLASPPKIVIANHKDEYAATADEDGFGSTTDWASAAAQADVLFLLVPDQVQPELFNTHIAPHLKPTSCIVVASGYNIFYNHLSIPPNTNDIAMVAPRMIGTSVRSRYLSGMGFPCFVSVERDSTGSAWPVALALCRGIGATKAGAIESSCREETLMDLFAEQALWPLIITGFREGYKVLKELGCSDEALVHEMWLSKEPAEIFEKAADDGFIKQLAHHSSVSQYGQLKGSLELDATPIRKQFQHVAEKRILGGAFAKEFTALHKSGGNALNGVEHANDVDGVNGHDQVKPTNGDAGIDGLNGRGQAKPTNGVAGINGFLDHDKTKPVNGVSAGANGANGAQVNGLTPSSSADTAGSGFGVQKKLQELYGLAYQSDLAQGEKKVRERLDLL
ncbi:MAG: hypothetical protein M1831_004701 [Alyxoria varia]|nr:MAG: hypothetical protein M1831_004701 [Alyxoria varia]